MTLFKGIISAVRAMPDMRENVYFAVGKNVVQFKSNVVFSLCDTVEFEIPAIQTDGGVPLIENALTGDKVTLEELEANINAVCGKITIEDNAAELDELLSKHNEIKTIVKNMNAQLLDCARAFLASFVSGAPIIVRFHNDGDGSSGAMALYAAVNGLQRQVFINGRQIIWKMQRGIAYDDESMYEDMLQFGQYDAAKKPVVVIIDFGTSPESESAVHTIKDKADLLWLDHHPTYDGFPKDEIRSYINPWDFGGNSDFTAGALACAFATILYNCDAAGLIEASLVSDYSAYADYGDRKAQDMALILDFLTSGSKAHGMANMTPKTFSDVFADKARYGETLMRARSLLEEALEIGMQRVKHYKSEIGINVYVLDFGHIAELGKGYPLPGRFSSRLQDRIEELNAGKTITVVHYGNYISMRESNDVVGRIKILDVVNELKKASPYVKSGGGHNEAASIKVLRENTQYVLKLLLKYFGVESG